MIPRKHRIAVVIGACLLGSPLSAQAGHHWDIKPFQNGQASSDIAGGAFASALTNIMNQLIGGNLPSINDLAKLHAGQEEQIGAQKNLLNQQLQGQTDQIRQVAAAKESNRYLMQTNPVAQLGNGGCVSEAATALGSGGSVSTDRLPAIAGGDDLPKPDDTRTKQEQLLVKSLTESGANASALFDSKASDQSVSNVINALVSPYPPPALTSSQDQSPAAIAYKARYNALRTQLSMASNALRFIAADYRPSAAITTTDIQSIAKLVNLSNPPKAPMSHHDLIDMVVNATYISNKDWSAWLAATNEAGAWRAVALLRALQAEEDDRNQSLKERLVALMAANQSIKSKKSVDAANEARAEAVAQSIQ